MGIFYTNITLQDARQQEVADYLKRNQREAYVSSVIDGCVVVFDSSVGWVERERETHRFL